MGWTGPLTERQVLAWEAWLDLEVNRPGKTELYLMALRASLLNINRAEGTPAVSVDDMRLELSRPAPDDSSTGRDPKVVAGWMKARARGRFANLTVINVDSNGTVISTEGPGST